MPEATRALREGAGAFARGDYAKARESFARLAELRPDRESQALLAASNLRESNFSLAREHFIRLTDPPFEDPDLADSVGLGLALALFNLVDLEGALPHAEAAYRNRLERLGPESPETASAGNILGGILIGLGRAQEAEGILETTVKAAMGGGRLTPSSPVVSDSLNILALSYGLRDSGKDVFDLLPSEYAELAGPPPATGRTGTARGAAARAPGEEGLLPPDAADSAASGDSSGSPVAGSPGAGTAAETAPGGAHGAVTGGTSAVSPDGTPAVSADGGASSAAPPVNYPEMLSVYNALSREYPHSPVRSELLKAMAGSLEPGRGSPACRDPGESLSRESLWYLCVGLADALVAEGAFDEGFRTTGELLEWPEAQSGPARHQVFRNAAYQNSREGHLAGTEEFLRLALAAAAAKDEPDPEDVSFIIIRAITLADTVLRQGKPELEAEIELTASITLLERKLPRRALDTYVESPLLFWYLARVLRDEGRTRDARSYFDRAIRASDSAARAHPESAQELERLTGLVRADRNWRRSRGAPEPPGFPQSPRIFFEAETRYADHAARTASPSAMRLELQGWRLLGRISEFEGRIDEAIGAQPPGSAELLRYRSLKLRYLEEIRDWPRLFAELELMTVDPPVDDPRGKAIFLSSAKGYEARMREASGDPYGASVAYEAALEHLHGVPDTDAARADVAGELARLRAALAPASGQTPAAGGAQGIAPPLQSGQPTPQ
jgi:tetratricopeptide (TPR) repeat protein